MLFMHNPNKKTVAVGDKVKLCYKDHDDSGWSATTGVIDGIVDSIQGSDVTFTVSHHFGFDDALVSPQSSAMLQKTITVADDFVFCERTLTDFRQARVLFQK